MNKKIAMTLLAATALGTAFLTLSPKEVPYSAETMNLPVVDSSGSFQSFPDVQTMFEASDLIAEVRVQSQETKSISEGIASTRSIVEITKVYKGDHSLKSIMISEPGGVVDLTEVKGNETRSSGAVLAKHQKYEEVLEHSPVMRQGETYIAFLIKNPYFENGYNIAGSIQGKLKLDKQSGKLYSTVESDHVNEAKKLFHFHYKFAGKSVKDFATEMERLLEKQS